VTAHKKNCWEEGALKRAGEMAVDRRKQTTKTFLAISFSHAFACAISSVSAAEANAGESLLMTKLEAMHVKEPTAVLTTLHSLGLELDVDFAILSEDEREEMVSGLRAQGISLGDRSKVRHDFGTLQTPMPVLVTTNAMHGDPTFTLAGPFYEETKLDDGTHSKIVSRTVANGLRRTQDSQGVSSDSIALMATAVLGILSFAVQARVSANEQKKQVDLDRETAERDKEQVTASKQLERVQLQLAEFIDPAFVNILTALESWIYVADAVGLEGYLALYQSQFMSQPATPLAKMINNASPKMWRAVAMAPLYAVHDVDIEMLQGDAAKRQLYADLIETTHLPPLQAFSDIMATKSHLAPWFNPARLDKALPGLGQSWATKATLINIFLDVVIWARQFEAVLARMKAGDNSLLAPTHASLIHPVMMALPMMKDVMSKKELALLGVSQGKSDATAQIAGFIRAGAEPEVEDT
jgi:hypothetical protein